MKTKFLMHFEIDLLDTDTGKILECEIATTSLDHGIATTLEAHSDENMVVIEHRFKGWVKKLDSDDG